MDRPTLISAAIACEEAKKGNVWLDLMVFGAIGASITLDKDGRIYSTRLPNGNPFPRRNPTTSLDAIAALTEELLPHAHVATEGVPGAFVCAVTINGFCSMSDDECATEPLARCAALLRALAEKEQER